jgi:hypothetical protein
MALTPELLVGTTRAEFAKSSRWRLRLLVMQFLATVPAALSVVVTDGTFVYMLGIVGPVLLLLWWLARARYRRLRSAAHSARRAGLIIGGLGHALSPEENLRLHALFTAAASDVQARMDAGYYATSAGTGPARLAQMIEESALHSKEVHRASAMVMIGFFVLFVAVALAAALIGLPYADRSTAVSTVRIVLAAAVFLLSSDVLGAMTEHLDAARGAEDVQARMAAAYARGYPPGDVLAAMGDYNYAMEGAPEAIPGTYRVVSGRINRLWAEYSRERDARRLSSLGVGERP